MKPEDELILGEPRLLTTDRSVILLVHTLIKVLVTSEDVIHS